ncbi:MAG: YciI family protein [Terrimicrobiaceae bacterium]
MKTQHQEDYLLLFRGNAWLKQLSDAEVQKVTSEWMNWFEGLVQEGKCKGGHPLRDMGKLVTGKRGHIVIDGPFAESKEAIGGYFHLRVADEAEAVAIAQQCPGLEYGCVVEVRPLAERCTDRVLASHAAIASW